MRRRRLCVIERRCTTTAKRRGRCGGCGRSDQRKRPGPSPSTPRENPSDGNVRRVPLDIAIGKVIDAADIDGLLETELRIVAKFLRDGEPVFRQHFDRGFAARLRSASTSFWPSLDSSSLREVRCRHGEFDSKPRRPGKGRDPASSWRRQEAGFRPSPRTTEWKRMRFRVIRSITAQSCSCAGSSSATAGSRESVLRPSADNPAHKYRPARCDRSRARPHTNSGSSRRRSRNCPSR